MKTWLLWAALLGAGVPLFAEDRPGPVVLEQCVSRESTAMRFAQAKIAVGRDGRVYVYGPGTAKNFACVLRMTLEGRERYGRSVAYAITGAAANAQGGAATSHAHFNHRVAVYGPNLADAGALSDFQVSDALGWDAPARVDAGETDFYGLDQHCFRILRISPSGQLVKAYALPRDPKEKSAPQDFRVVEKLESFFVVWGGKLRRIGFDGKEQWARPGWSTLFDVDDDGTAWQLPYLGDALKRVGPGGDPLPDVKVDFGARKPAKGQPWFVSLCVSKDALLLRVPHESELFQQYDLKTGAFVRAVDIDQDRLTVTLPSRIWTAGEAVPCTLAFSSAGKPVKPRWRFWLRPFEGGAYRELACAAGSLQVPADLSGLYRFKVTPEAEPADGSAVSEYIVQTIVECRPRGAKGSLSVATPENRVYYGAGEAVPFAITARGAGGPVTLELRDASGVLATRTEDVKAGAPAAFELPAALTRSLRPGAYELVARADGFTSAPQRLELGPGLAETPFQFVQYGDYGPVTPAAGDPYTVADLIDDDLATKRRLGLNLLVDRLGHKLGQGGLSFDKAATDEFDALAKRLEADPLAVAPQKARLAAPFLQGLAAYGAYGIRYMPILLANDAGLPLGTGYDTRKPEEMSAELARVTALLAPYPGFRGWTWASNWWVFGSRGSKAAATPEEKAACDAALKKAAETGAWDPVIDTVSARRFGYAVDAEERFAKDLNEAAPKQRFVSAVAAPYRNAEAYPPVTLSKVDEVDLQIQWEQMAVPYHAPHNVDFYKRPGMRGWAHPEVWNDDGTGGQVLPAMFSLAMRGADGVGFSGKIVPWNDACGEDPRSAHFGYASVWHAFGKLQRLYGPFFQALESDDDVAILATARMYKADTWVHVTGLHFARQLEAYISCLHAHHPARVLFSDDLKPGALAAFKAVLLVDERVDFEPAVLAELKAAKAAGTAVLYDATCRETLVKDFAPLGVSFDKLEKDRSPAGDDDAYARFASYAQQNLPVLAKALDATAPRAAGIDEDEILVTRRKAQDARYLWVVNNTLPRIDPGLLWRMNLAVTTRVPLALPVRLPGEPKAVYDVFAMRRVEPKDGAVTADLRSLPARLFALLPKPIAQVEARLPAGATAGLPLAWSARVLDEAGAPIAATVPLRVRLLAADSAVLDERCLAAGPGGASGTFTVPRNAPKGAVAFEACELLSGLSVKKELPVAAAAPADLIVPAGAAPAGPPAAPAPADQAALGKDPGGLEPADALFGPHVRDLAIAGGGRVAVLNTMNWDHNLYGVNVETGEIAWRRRIGQYYAFAPAGLERGAAAQGFDFNAAEGYFLYLLGEDGAPERRFPLFGVPGRLPFRFVPGLLHDRTASFAVAADGSWVASAGNLGLAVWSRDGKLLWQQPFWKTGRHSCEIKALGSRQVLVVEGMQATAYAAADGARAWSLDLRVPGQSRGIFASADGRTVAILASPADGGGRCYVVREGALARILPGVCSTAEVSADGERVAVAVGEEVACHSVADGLIWTRRMRGPARTPRFSADGARLAVGSDDGFACVLDANGALLWSKDFGARPVPAWLGADILWATWQGGVCRVGADGKERWARRLEPAETDMRGKLLAADGVPSVPLPAWGNAEAAPLPLTPNLLADAKATVRFIPQHGGAKFALDYKLLFDGRNEPPPQPWLDWMYVGFFAETSPMNVVQVELPNARIRLDAVTLTEDPAHPESWLRDLRLEYWDAATNGWEPVQELLSNQAVHTHRLAKPVEAGKFRFVLPWGVVGNLRLAELVFHGERLAAPAPPPKAPGK